MIGIIGAMKIEIDLLKNNLLNYKKSQYGAFVFYSGKINEKEVVVCQSGIGKVNAAICTSVMINNFEIDFIINTGIAGGITNLKHNDVVLVTKYTYSDVDVTIFNYELGQVPNMPKFFVSDVQILLLIKKTLQKENIDYIEGTSLTSDKFISNLKQLGQNYIGNNYLCEMEGAAIAQCCYSFNKPIVSIRYISDIVGEVSQIDNYSEFEKETANKSAIICHKIISALS